MSRRIIRSTGNPSKRRESGTRSRQVMLHPSIISGRVSTSAQPSQLARMRAETKDLALEIAAHQCGAEGRRHPQEQAGGCTHDIVSALSQPLQPCRGRGGLFKSEGAPSPATHDARPRYKRKVTKTQILCVACCLGPPRVACFFIRCVCPNAGLTPVDPFLTRRL